MASERRAQVVRLAEILGLEFERSSGTAELMDRCVHEADRRLGSGEGVHESDQGESAEEESDEAEQAAPEGMRRALRSLPAPEDSDAKHRAGGSGARKQRQSRARYEAEQGQIARMAEVGRPGAPEGSEAALGEPSAVLPALELSRSNRRGGARKAS